MKRIIQLKEEALDALQGHFGKAAFATLVFILIYLVVSLLLSLGQEETDIMDMYRALLSGDYSDLLSLSGFDPLHTSIELLVSIFFFVPLTVGCSNAFRVLLESKGSDNAYIKNYFKLGFGKNYLHIVWVMIVTSVLTSIMTVAAALIPVIIILIARNWFVTVICILAILFLAFMISLMYSMVAYIVLDNPELGAIDSMRRSRNLMDGNKWKLFFLQLSFIGWFLLGIFTLFIGYLWLIPYMTTTESAFYCDVRDAEKAA